MLNDGELGRVVGRQGRGDVGREIGSSEHRDVSDVRMSEELAKDLRAGGASGAFEKIKENVSLACLEGRTAEGVEATSEDDVLHDRMGEWMNERLALAAA